MAASAPDRDLAWVLAGPAEVAAPLLLGAVLVRIDDDGHRSAGRIVEVEAYSGATDPASHAHRGPTARNATMFGPAGHLYVYRSYGIHWCANLVCGPEGVAGGVLLRALRPTAGQERMAGRRGLQLDERVEAALCRGPGNLCRALGITGAHDGLDALDARSSVQLLPAPDDPPGGPPTVVATPRIGIARAAERPWRFAIAGERAVSGPRRVARPQGRGVG